MMLSRARTHLRVCIAHPGDDIVLQSVHAHSGDDNGEKRLLVSYLN